MTGTAAKAPGTAAKAPPGLGSSGRRLWRDVTGDYVLRADELLLLEKACRTADDCARLDAAAAAAPLLVAGSMGQQRVNPLLAEARQCRALLAALLKQLGLPDEPATASVSGRVSAGTRKAQTAARARWTGRRGA